MEKYREICFRAKRKMDGEWCYGQLFKRAYSPNGKLELEPSIQESVLINDNSIMFYDHEIDPSTIGQYTGKNDLSGRKIFEGDILKDIELDLYYVVVWNTWGFRMDNWDVRRCPEYRRYGVLAEMTEYDMMLIVGNIWDTPELMEKVLNEDP